MYVSLSSYMKQYWSSFLLSRTRYVRSLMALNWCRVLMRFLKLGFGIWGYLSVVIESSCMPPHTHAMMAIRSFFSAPIRGSCCLFSFYCCFWVLIMAICELKEHDS